jgi:hypothetical protein
MLYIVKEAWKYSDETKHTFYSEVFTDRDSALIKAKELVNSEKRLFKLINKEYHIIVLADGYSIESTDSEYEYTASIILIEDKLAEEKVSGFDKCLDNINKVYHFLSSKYNEIISKFGEVPDLVEVSIRWKNDDKSERAIIAFNDKHDELVTFRVNNLLEFALLFFKESKEDFVCENAIDTHFGIWAQ